MKTFEEDEPRPFMQVIVDNPKCLEYGIATIPLPIPNEEYDHVLRVLDALEIGKPGVRDCEIDEIISDYPILKGAEGSVVNIDELDYLAKRLEGFTDYEVTQFQTVASHMGITSIPDLINLTFCCQQATVITDFSNLEAVGRAHYMNLHDGCASKSELDALDGHETALLLIDSGAGVVTPYGVVYGNGMRLSHDYNGHHLPTYLYEPSEAVIRLSLTGRPEESEMLYFPCPDSKIERAMRRLEVDRLSECCAEMDMTAHMSQEVQALFTADADLGEHLFTLNHLAQCYKSFDERAREDFHYIVNYACLQTPEEALCLAENLYDFAFVRGVQTSEEYGEYIIKQSGRFNVDPNLEDYIDFKKYGERRIQIENGVFTEQGYLAYLGTVPEVEEILARQGQEEEPVFDQQMGGMGC